MNELMFRILLLVVTMLSPDLRKSLETMLIALEADAKKTANPWDDVLVAILKTLIVR